MSYAQIILCNLCLLCRGHALFKSVGLRLGYLLMLNKYHNPSVEFGSKGKQSPLCWSCLPIGLDCFRNMEVINCDNLKC